MAVLQWCCYTLHILLNNRYSHTSYNVVNKVTGTTDMQQNSLVKYNTPILVSTTGDKGKKKGKGSAPANDRQTSQTEDILNSILPPRYIYVPISVSCEGIYFCVLENGQKTGSYGCSMSLALPPLDWML